VAEQRREPPPRDRSSARRSASPPPPAAGSPQGAAGSGGPLRAPGSGPEVVLHVQGPLDVRGTDRLRAQLEDAAAPRRRLVLELADVEHVSAAALAVLVSGHRRLRDSGGALVLRSPSPALVRELRISGLHRVIAVDPPEPVHP